MKTLLSSCNLTVLFISCFSGGSKRGSRGLNPSGRVQQVRITMNQGGIELLLAPEALFLYEMSMPILQQQQEEINNINVNVIQ